MSHHHLEPYQNEDERRRAVIERDEAADGRFYYVVRTTGTYSRPSCVARSARLENMMFFKTAAEARARGYRPCQRCRPDDEDPEGRYAVAVTKACRVLERSPKSPNLDELARMFGYSRFHFHRMFKSYTGVTPHAYLTAARARKVRAELLRSATVSDAIYNAGFGSNGHFYATSADILGMTPTEFRAGGQGLLIRHVIAKCSLGLVLVAVAGKGVCAVIGGTQATTVLTELEAIFPHAQLEAAEDTFAAHVRAVVQAAERATRHDALPVDIRWATVKEHIRQAL